MLEVRFTSIFYQKWRNGGQNGQKEFTQELKNKRLASGLSQGQLAELLHISRYSINRFENGKANAGKETQNRILQAV